jgi:methylated-DNA-protein-cysteine methyltransferase-like protein
VAGADEVLVRVRATSINPGEAKIRDGSLHARLPATFPSGQGSDIAGVVVPRTRAAAPTSERARTILARVRAVPEGFVRTYGDVSPGAPRLAGTVLAGAEDPSLPWHRIVRADGSLAQGTRQRRLLRREGVPFRGERVDMRVARMIGSVE